MGIKERCDQLAIEFIKRAAGFAFNKGERKTPRSDDFDLAWQTLEQDSKEETT